MFVFNRNIEKMEDSPKRRGLKRPRETSSSPNKLSFSIDIDIEKLEESTYSSDSEAGVSCPGKNEYFLFIQKKQ